MLLAQLQEIIDIDTRISEMHRELADLYATRSSMIEPQDMATQAAKKAKKLMSNDDLSIWCHQEYDKLMATWKRYDLAIPSYKQLQTRLAKANSVMADLAETRPELRGNLTVVLVPPTKLIGFPLKPGLRKQQDVVATDYINPEITPPAISKKWQVLVAYTANTGLYLGSPATILRTESYMLGSHDTRGLGLLEYAALRLQLSQPIDNQSWTVLLKDGSGSNVMPSVSFQDGRLRYDLEDVDSVFGDTRFRPAVIL